MNIIEELAKFRDIKYYDEPHKYYRNGEQYTSVTTLLHHYAPFDTEGVAKSESIRKGISIDEVLLDWKGSGVKGSIVHDYMENYLANKIFPYPVDKVRTELGEVDFIRHKVEACIKLVEKFCKDSANRLIPIKSEFVVYDDYSKIAGMIDQIFFNKKSNKLEIWDWKTNNAIRLNSYGGEKMVDEMSHLDNCNYMTYSLQLSMYKYIIMKNTDLEIGDIYLTWFNEKNDNYVVYRCPYLAEEIETIINVRMSKM